MLRIEGNRRIQTGIAQNYAMLIVVGLLAVVGYLVIATS
jgi:hypothetical protein